MARAVREAVPLSPRDDPFNFIKRTKKKRKHTKVFQDFGFESPQAIEPIKMNMKAMNNDYY